MIFYQTTDCTVTVERIRWNLAITNFKCYQEDVEKNDEEKSEPLKIAKNFSIMRQPEAVANHLNLKICLKIMLLSCAVREKEDVDPVLPLKAEGKPHFVKCGSAEADVTRAASHDYP